MLRANIDPSILRPDRPLSSLSREKHKGSSANGDCRFRMGGSNASLQTGQQRLESRPVSGHVWGAENDQPHKPDSSPRPQERRPPFTRFYRAPKAPHLKEWLDKLNIDFPSHESQQPGQEQVPAAGPAMHADCNAPAPDSTAFNGPTPAQQALFAEKNLDGAIVAPVLAAYRRVGVQLNPKTYPWFFCHQSRLSRLGCGGFNDVEVVTMSTPESTFRERFALKRESANRNISEQEEVAGINVRRPQHGLRNLATCAVAEALGWPVVPRTRFALIRQDANGEIRLSLSLAMKVVDGHSASTFKNNQWFCAVTDKKATAHFSRMLCTPPVRPQEWNAALRQFGFHHVDLTKDRALVGCQSYPNPKIDFNHPQLKRELTMLAFLDFIVGHLDRHRGNYKVNMKPSTNRKGAMVGGYDNDATFGKNLRTPDDFRQALQSYAFFSVGLPEVIDTEMADSVRKLNLRDVLEDLLGEPEIQAAQARLDLTLNHIDQLAKVGKVINPGHWAQQKFEDPARSYIAREGLQPAKISPVEYG
jgi:hypothetical protein